MQPNQQPTPQTLPEPPNMAPVAPQVPTVPTNPPAASTTPVAPPVATIPTPPVTQYAAQQTNQAPAAKPARENPRPDIAPTAKAKDDKAKNSAQNSLLISEIRDNLVIMNDGSFRAIIVCQSINYDLMSEEERVGIEYSYQNFLNSLYFSIQISVGSRRIDLSPYIEKLEGIRREQDNMLLGHLTDDYLDFIFDISQRANIMAKNFFVIIPYDLTGDADSAVNSLKSIQANVMESQKNNRIKITASNYAKAKEEITNRVNVVLGGLTAIGIQAGQLPTKALAEMYYNFYNPDTAINEPMGDYRNFIGNLYTRKATGPNPNNPGGQL